MLRTKTALAVVLMAASIAHAGDTFLEHKGNRWTMLTKTFFTENNLRGVDLNETLTYDDKTVHTQIIRVRVTGCAKGKGGITVVDPVYFEEYAWATDNEEGISKVARMVCNYSQRPVQG